MQSALRVAASTKVRREQPASTPENRPASTRPATRRRMAIASDRCIPGLQRTLELGLAPGPVHDLALELAAGRVDVVAAGEAHRRDPAGVVELLLAPADPVFVRAFITPALDTQRVV